MKILLAIPIGRKVLYTHQIVDWQIAVVPAAKTIQRDVIDGNWNQDRHTHKLIFPIWLNYCWEALIAYLSQLSKTPSCQKHGDKGCHNTTSSTTIGVTDGGSHCIHHVPVCSCMSTLYGLDESISHGTS